MRTDKQKAFELRRNGMSYRAIHEETGISKGTLSKWFSGSDWSEGLRQKLVRDGKGVRVSRFRDLNQARSARLTRLYETGREEAVAEFRALIHDPLFLAGITLYYADGDRGAKTPVRLSTSDTEKARVVLAFLTGPCGVPRERVRASLMAYPGQDGESNRRFWAFALGPGLRFTKTVTVPGPHTAQKLRYGVCTLTVSSVYLKVKMLEWVKLLPKRLLEGR